MKKYVIAAIGLVAIIATMGLVSAGYGPGTGEHTNENYIDNDGDGVCDNWVDADGDGINDGCLMDGSGNQYRYGGRNSHGSQDGYGFQGHGRSTGSCLNE